MGLLGGSSSEESKDVIFEIYQDDEGQKINYNLDISHPLNLIDMIKMFKEEITRLEEILDRLDANDMYEKRMEEFDVEDLKESYEEKDEILGLKFRND